MSTEATINIQPAWMPLRTISGGKDGDALFGSDDSGELVDLRVLSRASESRCEDLRDHLKRIDLVDHASVRKVAAQLSVVQPPTLKLAVPRNLDPHHDRLSNRVDELSDEKRMMTAAMVVDATIAAHRVGLHHGSFAASTVLVSFAEVDPVVLIDFTSTACSEDVQIGELSIEHDLSCLQRLMAFLIVPVLNKADSTVHAKLGGRSRAILKQWTQPIDESDAFANATEPPALDQWASILDAFAPNDLSNDLSNDETGVRSSPVVRVSTSSTSQLRPGTGVADRIEEPVPTKLGRFEIGDRIGKGGMGTVYRATDLANGDQVAVKVLRRHGNDIAQSIRRFRKEARLLADVTNDHVTELIEVGEDNGFHFLAMEFIDGVDLKSWLAGRGALPEVDALKLAADLARSLVDAHAREIVHRDFKPENVLLKLSPDAPASDAAVADRPLDDFTVKLTDFGIARHINQSESMEVTRAGSVMGTPKYMSPEQCRSSDELGPAADVYSLGITMFELLTGNVPFQSDDFMRLASMHCHEAPPAIQKQNAKVSDATASIVNRALAKKPRDRFGDAQQLLSAILSVSRGESAAMEAHPRLPSEHTAAKVWDKTVTWQLDSEPSELWPLVSNTERLNEAIGLPSVDYRTEKDPDRGIRKFGAFTLSGVRVSWEEHPFEWIEGQRMGILREFDSGPFKWFLSVVTLDRRDGGGTKLSHRIRIEPRNVLGRVLTTVEADWKGFRNLQKVYQRMDKSLQGKLDRSGGSDPFAGVKALSKNQASRLTSRMDRVIESGAEQEAARAIETMLQQWSAQDLAQIRPIAAATQLDVQPDAFTNACLIAAAEGVLQLRWDILCPTCRVSALASSELSNIQSHTHCEACDIDFQSNLAGSIELVFQAHPEIRQINQGQYCIGGPEHSPHVVAQVRIAASECLDLPTDLGPGDYLIRGPRLPKTQAIRIQSSSAPSSIDFSLSTLGQSIHTPKMRAGQQVLTLMNDLSTLHVVRIERMIARDDVVTAATASANPLFRKLFPGQCFAENNPITTEVLTFVAASINNVDRMYQTLGESEAYLAIRDHHDRLTVSIEGTGGTVVKTVGESLLAVFPNRDDAVLASKRIRESREVAQAVTESPAMNDPSTETKSEQTPWIELGIGIHSGPTMVATQNNQLDYFGTTVRSATKLADQAGQDTLITESVYSDPFVSDQLTSVSDEVEMFDLPGISSLRVKRL